MNQAHFYRDYLYKKAKPKAEALESQLEFAEQHLAKINQVPSLYNLSIPTQEDVWICGRVYNENMGGGGGKLNEHNVVLQGSYVCSNNHSIPLNLGNCPEYSLFPGQIILANGRNPDGKKFICKQIIEPPFVSEQKRQVKQEASEPMLGYSIPTNYSINVDLGSDDSNNKELNILVASGPYMMNGSILFSTLINLINVAKAKKAHLLVLLGPFIDANHDLISGGNLPNSYDELFQKLIDDLANELQSANIKVIIQPSLNDLTQEPIYPVHPFNMTAQFIKQNEYIHFVQEPCMVKINDIQFAITSTDIIKDLTTTATSKSASTDKIARNFSHLLRQKSFYPIYPPPEHVCIDYETWSKYARIETPPSIFIASSDLATFNKEVNNCYCINPGRLVKGTSTGTYAQIVVSHGPKPVAMETAPAAATQSIPSTFNPATQSKLSDELSFIEQYAMANKPVAPMDTQEPAPAPVQASTQMPGVTSTQTAPTQQHNGLNVSVSFHKI